MGSDELPPDGERYLPQFQGVIRLEHYHRYLIAATLCAGRDVLDIASGEGFGTALLARHARQAVGVDISEAAVRHAARGYAAENLAFRQGSATAIPLPDASVDMVVSFETIEHLAEHDAMMAELCRVLRPGGLLLMSSPNKAEYSDRANYANPFHVRELYTEQLLALTARHFANSQHFGQRVTAASVIAAEGSEAPFVTFRHTATGPGVMERVYDLVLASDGPLPPLPHSIFEEPDSPLQPNSVEAAARRQVPIEAIERHIQELRSDIGDQITRRDRLEAEITQLRDEMARREALPVDHVAMQAQNAELDRYRLALQSAIADGNAVVKDKWWRRTRLFRRLSNSLRKRRGKPQRTWPESFEIDRLLSHHTSSAPAQASSAVTPGTASPRVRAIDPLSGHVYPSSIDAIAFSDISEEPVPFADRPPMTTSPRTIAFYLPQFHPFPENDAWWGKGFTEWTNVGKAKPLFEGHYQPHCPIHLGYYDLRVPSVMEEQARMARAYGVNGFAYYFYWFGGKLLMNGPLEAMLANPAVDMPFCFIWANENWTRRWDGQENDVLIGQSHSLEDSRALLHYLRKFFDDGRYITIDGKPLFVVYRPGIIPDIEATLKMWRAEAQAMGFPGLYLVSAQTFGHLDPREYGFDAAMDFPPHTAVSRSIAETVPRLNPGFTGCILNYEEVVGCAVTRPASDYKVFPTAMLSWDNTARKGNSAHVFANFSVLRYSQWMAANAERVARDSRYTADEKLIFVNAWNEWAEGTHLEPDQKHGFGYLEATRRVLENYTPEAAPFINPPLPARQSDMAVILHLHFPELMAELAEGITRLGAGVVDVYATATSVAAAQAIRTALPEAHIELVDNRGRDIRPFLYMLRRVSPLGYTAIAKVHGKKSVYRGDGDDLRRLAYGALLTPQAMARMRAEPGIGLLAREGSLVPHTDKNMTFSGPLTELIAHEIGLKFAQGRFPAGSMFWFRPEALAPLLKIGQHTFDVERGLVDGTRAHAIERLFCTACESSGFTVAEITGGGSNSTQMAAQKPIPPGNAAEA